MEVVQINIEIVITFIAYSALMLFIGIFLRKIKIQRIIS